MIPFRYDFEPTYLEKVEREAKTARAEETARLLRYAGFIVKAAIDAVARLFKPVGDPAGRHAA